MADYYGVAVGRVPGVYKTWDECKNQTDGYKNAKFKKFKNYNDAAAFAGLLDNSIADVQIQIGNQAPKIFDDKEIELKYPYAFVDGSYNQNTNTFGYGGFLIVDEDSEPIIIQGSAQDPELAAMRNVAGEIHGSMAAIKKALELGLPELHIYYDYMGIECWANGTWKRNKAGTIAYHDFIQSIIGNIKLYFVKVAAHTGIPGNEEADRLAKQSVGIE